MGPAPVPAPTFLGFPLNRIVAFVGPYVSVFAGGVSTWLFTKLHFLALFHVTHASAAKAITAVTIWAITSVLTYAGQHKWLTGWQQYEANATLTAPVPLVPDQGDPGPDALK